MDSTVIVMVPVSRLVQLALMDFQAYLSTSDQDSLSGSSGIGWTLSRPQIASPSSSPSHTE
jgi:hypothetical protein